MRGWVVATSILVAIASGPSFAGEPAPVPAAEPEAGRVVARVNGVEITYGQFKKRVEVLQRERGGIPPDRYGEVLRGMVQEEVLIQAAGTEGVERDPGIQARLEQVRRQVLIEELLRRKIVQRVEVTTDEARKMYDENKALFSAESVTSRHILVKNQAEAEAILKDLQAGKDFAEMAKEKSLDTGSAEKGGDLGGLRRGETVPEFEEEAFRLKEGELSPVIKTEYGYHILKGGVRITTTQPFDEVKDRIRQSLLQKKQQETFKDFLSELEKQAKTEIFESQLR